MFASACLQKDYLGREGGCERRRRRVGGNPVCVNCYVFQGSVGNDLVDNLQEPALWVTLRFSELFAIRYHVPE